MPSHVVKLRPEIYSRVKRLAEEQGASMQEVVARGIDALERQEFARSFQEDFAALRDDASAWEDEKAGRAAWEGTVADGLDE